MLNYVIRAVGMELKVREQEEILRRVEELEALLERQREQKGAASW